MRLPAAAIPVLAVALVFAALVQPGRAAGGMGAHRAAPGASSASNNEGTIRITAVVTDGRGQPLKGLTPADFELLVDGKPQTLETAELARDAATPRTYAFLLDEFHTAAADSAAVREALLQFVDEGLRPADLAVVVKPLDSLVDIRPTADRDVIRKAISTFEGRKGDFAPRTAFERDYMAQAPNAVAWARAQIVTSALRAIGVTLSDKTEVRPAIVLVSDGFARMRSTREVPANLQTAVRVANRADAPVYAFAPSVAADAAQADPDPALIALRALTAQTGGALFVGAGEVPGGLARMARDLEAHYVLTYRPEHGSDGRFHALQVAVKRQGVEVQARAGYVAPMSASMRAALAPKPSVPLRVLRRSPLIQAWSGMFPAAEGRLGVLLTWDRPARPAASPSRRASTVIVTASTPEGIVLFDGGVGPVSEAPSDTVPNVAAFEAAAGVVRVDMKVLDASGVVVDTDARDLTLATPGKGSAIIFPPAVLRTRSAREFRAVLGDINAAPVPTRDFRRTDRLLIRVPALDAAGEPAVVTAVLLNRWRQPMRAVSALPREAAATAAPVTQFDLPLAALAPGEYTLRLTVAGPGGASAAEHVTFRVQG